MSGTSSSMAAVGGVCFRPPFTATQWQELEHQALIYKYLVAGLPVPPDLLVPIRRSFELLSARFFHHSTLGYCSYYGKKLDPEPGRCRRTDGKKWRCSKDAYPDSKYCERHMHRGRNRSRKLVESQSNCQSSSTVISNYTGGSGGSGSFQSLPFHSIVNQEGSSFRSNISKLQMEPSPYDVTDKEYRYFHGVKPEAYEQNLSLEGSGSARVLGLESNVDNAWRLMTSSNVDPSSNPRYSACLRSDTPQLYMRSDYEPMSNTLTSKQQQQQQQQHCLFRTEIVSPVKEEHHAMRSFLDEGPTAKGLWPNFDDQGYSKHTFSNTQLSISVPVTSPEISTRNSSSPNDA